MPSAIASPDKCGAEAGERSLGAPRRRSGRALARRADVDLRARHPQVVGVHATSDARAAAIAQVGEDAQAELGAADTGRDGADRLRDGVDEVCAHRVFAVDQHVHDDPARPEPAQLDAAGTTAAVDQVGHGAPRDRQQVLGLGFEAAQRDLRIGQAAQLDLRDHQRFAHLGAEAAGVAHHARGVRGGRDHARLFDDHRHEAVFAVDLHVERDPERQGVGAEHVLDQLVGRRGVDAAGVERAAQRLQIDTGALRDEGSSFGNAQFVKTWQTRAAHRDS
jgi:hypothetical protein